MGVRVGVHRGVRQGDPLSPWLFNAVLDEVISLSNRRVGVALGSYVVDYLAYADDLVLLSSDPAGYRQSWMRFRVHLQKQACTSTLQSVPHWRLVFMESAKGGM